MIFQKIKYILFLSILIPSFSSIAQERNTFDQNRIDFEIKNRREAYAQMRFYKFLSENPEAVYVIDRYEESGMGNERWMENLHTSIQKEGFWEKVVERFPDLKVSGTAYTILGGEFGRNSPVKIGAQIQASIDFEKTWTAQEYLRWFYKNDTVQVEPGILENKILQYSKNLTHDTYACENTDKCRFRADPGYRYLFEKILQDEEIFSNFPQLTGEDKEYLSFEEIKAQNPISDEVLLIDNIYTNRETLENTENLSDLTQDTLKTTGELQSAFEQYLNRQDEKSQETIRSIRNQTIQQAIRLTQNEDPVVRRYNNKISDLQEGIQALEGQSSQEESSQEERDRRIQDFEAQIQSIHTSIDVYKVKKTISEAQEWVGAGVALAHLVGAPPEVIKTGQAIEASMTVASGIVPMLIAGAFDPTGITLAIAGVSSLVSILSDAGPSFEEVVMNQLNGIRQNQIRMIGMIRNIGLDIKGLDENLQKLEDVLNKNHQEIQENFDEIMLEIEVIGNSIYSLERSQGEALDYLQTPSRREAELYNEVTDGVNNPTISRQFNACIESYNDDLLLSKNKIEGVDLDLHICIEECLTTHAQFDRGIYKASSVDIKSCSENCSLTPSCDEDCREDIFYKKDQILDSYVNCIKLPNEERKDLEFILRAVFVESRNFSESTFVDDVLLSSDGSIELEEDNFSKEIEKRISHLPFIGSGLKSISDTIKKIDESVSSSIGEFNNLWQDDSLDRYIDLVPFNGVSEDSEESIDERLKNPEVLDLSFNTYVESLGMLPGEDVPIGIGGETYQYRLNDLNQMCSDVEHIENLSTVSRENIQNALVSFYTLAKTLKDHVNESVKSEINESIDDENSSNSDILQVLIDEGYIAQDYIGEDDSSGIQFLTADFEGIVNEIANNFNRQDLEYIQSRGFSKQVGSERKCLEFRGEEVIGEANPLNTATPFESRDIESGVEAGLDNPEQLDILENTFNSVQSGAQGGCWFTDRLGLVTGKVGQKIKLYQEGRQINRDGSPVLEPLCSVFVTATKNLWFMWWDWEEPFSRAICLEAELDFLYNSNFFDSRLVYYLTEDELNNIEEQPRINIGEPASPETEKIFSRAVHQSIYDQAHQVTPKDYLDRVFHMAFSSTLSEEEFIKITHFYYQISYSYYIEDGKEKERIPYDNDEPSYDYIVRKVIQDQYSSVTSIDDKDKFMKIDLYGNRRGIIRQQWIGATQSNRDSFGECKKFACLEIGDVAIEEADVEAWITQAIEDIGAVKNEIESNIKPESSVNTPQSQQLLFSKLIDELNRSIYYLDTLIKTGYGSANLQNHSSLSKLKRLIQDISSSPNLKQNDFIAQVQLIIDLMGRINEHPDILEENFVPLVSSNAFGFGDPNSRTQALERISRRDDWRSADQCFYREVN